MRSFAAVVLLTLVLSCNRLENQEIKMKVNNQLLSTGETDESLNVYYASPLSFQKQRDLTMKAKRKKTPPTPGASERLVAVYEDAETNSYMMITTSDEKNWCLYESYLKDVKMSPLILLWNNATASMYVYNGLSIQQWFLYNFEWINYRLLIKSADNIFFQVDYFIPFENYSKEVGDTIESSIGSFKVLQMA